MMTRSPSTLSAARLAVLCATLLAAAVPTAVSGDTDLPAEQALQQEDARRAVREGLVRPLEQILAEVRKSIDGDIVEIEFEKDDGRYVYEIEYVRRDGQLMEMKIDAATLAVLEHGRDD